MDSWQLPFLRLSLAFWSLLAAPGVVCGEAPAQSVKPTAPCSSGMILERYVMLLGAAPKYPDAGSALPSGAAEFLTAVMTVEPRYELLSGESLASAETAPPGAELVAWDSPDGGAVRASTRLCVADEAALLWVVTAHKTFMSLAPALRDRPSAFANGMVALVSYHVAGRTALAHLPRRWSTLVALLAVLVAIDPDILRSAFAGQSSREVLERSVAAALARLAPHGGPSQGLSRLGTRLFASSGGPDLEAALEDLTDDEIAALRGRARALDASLHLAIEAAAAAARKVRTIDVCAAVSRMASDLVARGMPVSHVHGPEGACRLLIPGAEQSPPDLVFEPHLVPQIVRLAWLGAATRNGPLLRWLQSLPASAAGRDLSLGLSQHMPIIAGLTPVAGVPEVTRTGGRLKIEWTFRRRSWLGGAPVEERVALDLIPSEPTPKPVASPSPAVAPVAHDPAGPAGRSGSRRQKGRSAEGGEESGPAVGAPPTLLLRLAPNLAVPDGVMPGQGAGGQDAGTGPGSRGRPRTGNQVRGPAPVHIADVLTRPKPERPRSPPPPLPPIWPSISDDPTPIRWSTRDRAVLSGHLAHFRRLLTQLDGAARGPAVVGRRGTRVARVVRLFFDFHPGASDERVVAWVMRRLTGPERGLARLVSDQVTRHERLLSTGHHRLLDELPASVLLAYTLIDAADVGEHDGAAATAIVDAAVELTTRAYLTEGEAGLVRRERPLELLALAAEIVRASPRPELAQELSRHIAQGLIHDDVFSNRDQVDLEHLWVQLRVNVAGLPPCVPPLWWKRLAEPGDDAVVAEVRNALGIEAVACEPRDGHEGRP